MASSIPIQDRAVDPFASYNSNTVNELTRMLTYGEDGLATTKSCDISLDSTSNTLVNLSTGILYKDDVRIEITAEHVVDFKDSIQYYNFDTGFDEAGYYYIVLEYTFVKSRPAPQAKILIVKPSQRGAYSPGGSWLFLKAVKVEGPGPFHVVSVHNSDPTPLYSLNKRTYIKSYLGSEVSIPVHNPQRDTSRVTYSIEEDSFYFGLSDKWGVLGEVFNLICEKNTSGFAKGDLVYVASSGNLSKAVSTLPYSSADGVVVKVGTAGKIQTTSKVLDVPIEPGITLNPGNLLYLSKSTPGTITNNQPTPYSQFVGRCITADSTSADILFVRGEPAGSGDSSLTTYVSDYLDSTAWIAVGPLYYQDVDISSIEEREVAVMVWDNATEMKIEPVEIEFVTINTMRIWMNNNVLNLNVLAIGTSDLTIGSSTVIAVNETLLAGAWIVSGAQYYQDVDISSIVGQNAVVGVYDTTTKMKIKPSNIQFDSTSNLRIWMSVNTQTLKVIAIGPSAVGSTLITLPVILASGGSWIVDGGQYYQDIDISPFGGNDIVFECMDDNTKMRIEPTDIQFLSNTAVRIWMPDNTHQLNVTIIG